MRKFSLITSALALTSSFALAKDAVSVGSIAGVYKVQVGEVFGRTPPMGEDILEIAEINPRAAYVRIHLESPPNAHLCNASGIANAKRNELVYRTETTEGTCVLVVSPEDHSIVLHDRGLTCQQTFCGANFGFDGVSFPRSKWRPIRYMKRLLASREYQEAIAEARKR